VDAFRTTRWSQILAVKSGDPERAREALSQLCQTYWYPIYSLVRRRIGDPDRAADLTQDFFVHLIEKEILQRANPGLGRLRFFLMASLRNFLANDHDRSMARKRGGGLRPITFDEGEAESRYSRDAHSGWEPERAFDRQWALAVLERTIDRLRSRYARADKAKDFELLSPFLTDAGPDRSYREVAAALGTTETGVKTAVHRMRRRYARALREEIATTVDDPAEIELELRHLQAALEG
jgi:RNA polymerase sigma factor (sigma-70 family)